MLSALTTRGSSLLRARRLIMGGPGATAPTPVVSEAEGRPTRAMRAPWRRVVWPYALAAYVALLVLLVTVLPEAPCAGLQPIPKVGEHGVACDR